MRRFELQGRHGSQGSGALETSVYLQLVNPAQITGCTIMHILQLILH